MQLKKVEGMGAWLTTGLVVILAYTSNRLLCMHVYMPSHRGYYRIRRLVMVGAVSMPPAFSHRSPWVKPVTG